MGRYPSRTTALGVTLFSFILDTLITGQILVSSSSLKWEEVEFEWEASDKGKLESLKLIWYLLLAYFGSSAIVAGYGFVGVLKNRAPMVRLYRDYSIADLAFRLAFTVLCAYYAFQTTTRLGVCEELSRHTELIQDLADTGLSTDNCERWFERAAMAFVGVMAVTNVIKLHFILGVSHYYKHLYRHSPSRSHSRGHSRRVSQDYLQRVYLLPRDNALPPDGTVMVYAPVPLSELSPEVAQNLKKTATEAYVPIRDAPSSCSSPTATRSRAYSNAYKNRLYQSTGTTVTGRISLPLAHDDGLVSSPTVFETPKDS